LKKIAALTAPVVLGTLLSVSSAFAATSQTQTVTAPTGFTTQTYVTGASINTISPDDLTSLNGNMYVAYQNGVPSKGGKGTNGARQSTIVEYDKAGKVIQKWNVTGKCDGMTADPANNRIIVTVNEDGNSSMYLVTPGQTTVKHLTYTPDPSSTSTPSPLGTGGGTDAITIVNGNVYLTASAPSADSNGKTYTKTALFQANIDTAKGTVTLSSILKDNATVTNAITGKSETLNLSDPDSTIQVPQISSKFAGDFMLDSQGDQELVFIHNLGSSNQSQQVLPLSAQVDDVVWATSSEGTLYVSDSSTNKVYTVKGNFKPGTVFASVGTSVGTLDLNTGKITPFITGLSGSHGMTFIPGSASTSTTTPAATTSSTSTKSVQGATSPKTGFPVEELLMEGLGLLSLGGGTAAAFLRKRKK
jgi:hypothetical protein